jgi:pSer/pThr/pTyr-binding forkhead associated (FHA) protein
MSSEFELSVAALHQMVCEKKKRIKSDADEELEDGKPNWLKVEFLQYSGSESDTVLHTNKETFNIGRNEDNDCVIRGCDSDTVSRVHCYIQRNPNGFAVLRDFSKFGTEHNGVKVETDYPYDLREGDQIAIGLRKNEDGTRASAFCTFSVHRVREDREGKKQKSS